MVIVVHEDDDGTKKKTREALVRTRDDFAKGTIIANELEKVLRRVRNTAYERCPKVTGTLANTIRITRIPMGTMTGGWSQMKSITIFNMSIIAGDLMTMNPITGKPCDYATWVHDGHNMRDGNFWGGIPFLTEAFAQHNQEVNKAIDRALKKIGKKFEKYGCLQLPQN